MTRQVTDNLYIDLGYFTPEEYYTYQAKAVCASSGSASMTANVGVIKQATSALTVTAIVTATISHIEGADLFAFTEAELAAQVSRIRDNNIAATAIFDVATDISRIQQGNSQEEAFTAINIDGFRVRYEEAAVDAAFSLSADAEVIQGGTTKEANADLTSEFSQSTTVIKSVEVSSSLSVEATISISEELYKDFASDLVDSFAFAVIADKTSTVIEELIVESSINVTFDRIREFASDENSLFTPSIGVEAVKNTFAVLDVISDLSSIPEVTRTLDANLLSSSSLAIQVELYSEFAINLSSTFTLNASALDLDLAQASLSSQFSVNAFVDKVKTGFNYYWYDNRAGKPNPNGTFTTTYRQQPTTSGTSITMAVPGSTNSDQKYIYSSIDPTGNNYPSNFLSTYNGEWTVEFWVYLPAWTPPTPPNTSTSYQSRPFFSMLVGGSNFLTLSLNRDYYGSSIVLTSSSGTSTSFTSGTMNHIAITRNSSGFINWYVNGALRTTGVTYWGQARPWYFQTADLSGGTVGQYASNLIIDEFRWSPTIRRYSSTFTPPTEKFSLDTHTVVFHFDDSNYNYTGINNASGTLSSVVSVVANVGKQKSFEANLVANGGLMVVTGFLNDEIVLFAGDSELSATVGKIGTSAEANLTAESTLSVETTVVQEGFADIAAATEQTTDVVKTVDLVIAVESNTTVSIDANKIFNTSAGLSAQGFVLAAVGKISQGTVIGPVDTTLSAIIKRTRGYQANIQATATLTASALDLDLAQANITATTTLTASLSRKTAATRANLTAFASQLTVARAVPGEEDLEYVLKVSYPGASSTVYGITDLTNVSIPAATGTLENVWANIQFHLAQNPSGPNGTFEGTTTVAQPGDDIVYSGCRDLIVHRYGTASVSLQKFQSVLRDNLGFGYTQSQLNYNSSLSTYFIVISTEIAVALNGGNGWGYWLGPVTWYKQLPNGFDFTQPINLHYQIAPRVIQTGPAYTDVTVISQSPSLNGSTSGWYSKIVFPGSGTFISGSGLTQYAPPILVGETAPGDTQSYRQHKFGGEVNVTVGNDSQTIERSTQVIDLNHLWVKSNTDVPASEFWINGAEKTLSNNGTTGFSYVPDVYISAKSRTFLDQNSNEPTWNYTGSYLVATYPPKEFYADMLSSISVVTNNNIVRLGGSQMQTTASMVSVPSRTRLGRSAQSATTNLSITYKTTKSFAAALQTQSNLSATVRANKVANVLASSTTQLVANNVRTRDLSSLQSSNFTQTAIVDKFKGSFYDIRDEFSLDLTPSVNRNIGVIQTDSIFTELAAVAKIGDFLIASDVVATMTVDGVISAGAIANITADTNLTAGSRVFWVGRSNQYVSAVMYPTVTKAMFGESVMPSVFQETVNGTKVIFGRMTTVAEFTLTAEATRTRDNSTQITASTTQITEAMRLRYGDANVFAQTEMYTSSQYIIRVSADLTAFNTTLTTGRVIHLDEYLTYRVPAESRFLRIKPENRVYTIPEETRILKVKGYKL